MSNARYTVKRMMHEHADVNLLLTLPYICHQSYKRALIFFLENMQQNIIKRGTTVSTFISRRIST